ncbi:MAG: PepSY domain-containing protein [Pleurocapsa sp. SU_196_0]|nr:PepSY domain-containing protein [Pleurocapsa sp. SU_196_0]
MPRKPWRPRVVIQRLHLWATLLVGAFLVVVTTTGSVALFRHELNRLAFPALYTVTPASQPINMDEARGVVQTAFPKDHVENIIRARDTEPYLFYVGENPQRTVTVDPGTASWAARSSPIRPSSDSWRKSITRCSRTT